MKKQLQKNKPPIKKRQPKKGPTSTDNQSLASTDTIPAEEENIAFQMQCQDNLRKSLHYSLIEKLESFSPGERLRQVFIDEIDILPILKKMNTWSIPIIESFIEIHGMFCDTGDGRASILANIFDRLNSAPSEHLVRDILLRSFYGSTRNINGDYDEFE